MSAGFDLDVGDLDFEDEDEDRTAASDGAICLGCGCSERDPCAGGCVWASANLCSRCV